jgi:hypothetical protein
MSGWDGNTRHTRGWIPSGSAPRPQVFAHLLREMHHHCGQRNREGQEESREEHDLKDDRHTGLDEQRPRQAFPGAQALEPVL